MAPANGGDILSSHPDRTAIRNKIKNTHKETIASMSDSDKKEKWSKPGDQNYNWRNGGKSSKLCPHCGIVQIASTCNSCNSCRIRTKEHNPFYNKQHTVETKEYLRKINSGDNSWIKGISPNLLPYTKIYSIIYTDGTVKKVAGLKAIAKEFNVSLENVHATIKRIAKGKIPKRGKFAGIIIKEIAK
jgi:hypothetical protein